MFDINETLVRLYTYSQKEGKTMTIGYLLEITHTDGSRGSEIYASRHEAEEAGAYYKADKELQIAYYSISETYYFQYGQDQF